MGRRDLLHVSKLEDFKAFLDDHNIAYRPGKGAWQVLQVLTPNYGWQCIFMRKDTTEHYSLNDPLVPIVNDFINSRKP